MAIGPQYLVVDEPTAGLDPLGAKEMMALFQKVHEEGATIILVTHDMALVKRYCDKVIVVDDGTIAKVTTPDEFFLEDIEKYSLDSPELYKLARFCMAHGADFDMKSIQGVTAFSEAIAKWKGVKHE